MYHDNQTYRESAYGNGNYNRETEYENPYGNNEYSYESENEYQLSPEYEFNNEAEYNNEYEGEYPMNEYEGEYEAENEYEGEGEYEGEYESEGEYGNQYESEYEGEMQQEDESGMYKDEMEAELEYVTNEAEFNNWVNEVVVRDHRTKNMRPVLRTPIGRNAIRQFTKIAARTLPFLGRKRGGWTRPMGNNRFWNRPGSKWGRHPYWRRNRGWRNWPGNSQFPLQSQAFHQAFQQQPFQPQPFQGAQGGDSAMPQQGAQDGSFRNFILDTIKGLAEQVAAGNQSIEALKNSMANSAATNMPGLVQPKTDGAPPPPGDTPPPNAGGQPPQPEFEMEDYEYNMESENEYTDREAGISEEQEMQLASELLSVNNESELDHFLGKLLKGAVSAVSGVLNSAEGKALKGILKKVAKKALPLVGGAVGSVIAPGVGTVVGQNVGNALVSGEIFELELEGLSNEDREFETARAFVRFGANAANQVMAGRIGSPQDNVRNGVTAAATRFAPGLLLRNGFGRRRRRFHRDWMGGNAGGGESGTWYRKGNRIIIENA
jgi:hypothetical protein